MSCLIDFFRKVPFSSMITLGFLENSEPWKYDWTDLNISVIYMPENRTALRVSGFSQRKMFPNVTILNT